MTWRLSIKKGTTDEFSIYEAEIEPYLEHLSNYSKKVLREIFDKFSDETGRFLRMDMVVKNVFNNNYPVSRSQAKRLVNRFDEYEEIILDFNGIEDIGQGFAHELFVVFANAHKDIKLDIINENENVRKMINHVVSN